MNENKQTTGHAPIQQSSSNNNKNEGVDANNIHSSLMPIQRINKSPATAAFDLRSLLAKRT